MTTEVIKAEKIPRRLSTRSPRAKSPKVTVIQSIIRIAVELFMRGTYLHMMKAMISTPPVEPPPRKVRAQPAPIITAPESAETISTVS